MSIFKIREQSYFFLQKNIFEIVNTYKNYFHQLFSLYAVIFLFNSSNFMKAVIAKKFI